jgi:WD40 repeat protein
MSELKRAHSPDVETETDDASGAGVGAAIVLSKKQKTAGTEIIAGTITKEVSDLLIALTSSLNHWITVRNTCDLHATRKSSLPCSLDHAAQLHELPAVCLPLAFSSLSFLLMLHAQGVKRTSNLLAPIMQLTGHAGEVYTMRFSPDGQSVASGSFDKQIFLWKVFGECENFEVLKASDHVPCLMGSWALGLFLPCGSLLSDGSRVGY